MAFTNQHRPHKFFEDLFDVTFQHCHSESERAGVMGKRIALAHTRDSVESQLVTLDSLVMQIEEVETKLAAMLSTHAEGELLKTLPYVGRILSMVMVLEIGDVGRFPGAAHLASYAGLVRRVHSSGDKTRLGQICGNVNRYLKWASVGAANLIAMHQQQLTGTYAVALYRRVKQKQNHAKAVVAVAHHLAEAAYWILSNSSLIGSLAKRTLPTLLRPPRQRTGKRGAVHGPKRPSI